MNKKILAWTAAAVLAASAAIYGFAASEQAAAADCQDSECCDCCGTCDTEC